MAKHPQFCLASYTDVITETTGVDNVILLPLDIHSFSLPSFPFPQTSAAIAVIFSLEHCFTKLTRFLGGHTEGSPTRKTHTLRGEDSEMLCFLLGLKQLK